MANNQEKEIESVRLLIKNTFSQLEFVEESHQYFLNKADSSKEELMCVSSFCEQFSKKDSRLMAEKYAAKHGETPEYWLGEWQKIADKATASGTLVHEYAESLAWVLNGHPENICPSAKAQYNATSNELLPLDGDDPVAKKQQAVFKFWKEMHPSLHFVLAENKVCTGLGPFATPSSTNYAGTFDLLLFYDGEGDNEKSGYCIFDYKTNKALEDPNAIKFKNFMKEPFADYPDVAKSHYTLQQSCYQIPLENIGLKVIARRLVWLKPDGSYDLVSLPNVTNEIRDLIR